MAECNTYIMKLKHAYTSFFFNIQECVERLIEAMIEMEDNDQISTQELTQENVQNKKFGCC